MKRNKIYVKLGLTLLFVVLASAASNVVFSNLPGFFKVIKDFFSIIMPILFGVLFAYLMNPVMQFVENTLMRLISRLRRNDQPDRGQMASRKKACHIIGVISALAVLLLFFYMAFSLVVPTLVENISTIANQETLSGYYERLTDWIEMLFSDSPDIGNWIIQQIRKIFDELETLISDLNILDALRSVSSQLFGVLKGTMDFLLGLVIAVYMLLSKEKFLSQAKKIVVAMFSEKRANRLLEVGRRTNKIFSGFVLGKIIDSLIIGIICYIIMSLIGLPYPMLISVIIGVTNVIPFFGPLIGAIPSAFLILLVNPLQCFILIIFILVLQKFDGNILGPRILGDSVGLSSFWILISISVFSGLFGFAGMILGVPVFAVIYTLISDSVKRRLQKKGYPQHTEIYSKIQSTDDIALAQKMAKFAAEHAAFYEDATETYEEEPEIIDIDNLSDEEIESYLAHLEDSGS